jgi:hypothetical protein
MKKLKVIVSIICFFFYITTAFLYAVDFKTQADVDNPANWEALNAEPCIFYGDFFCQHQFLFSQLKNFLPTIPI